MQTFDLAWRVPVTSFPARQQGGVGFSRDNGGQRRHCAELPALSPAGVICEIMNEDGSMSRLPELNGLPWSIT
jgi:3,4-dihydroxy 2-butanone 4-phosphate synthase/GTP cyclohydrolase II